MTVLAVTASPRIAKARAMLMTTLNLSIGTTLEASPILLASREKVRPDHKEYDRQGGDSYTVEERVEHRCIIAADYRPGQVEAVCHRHYPREDIQNPAGVVDRDNGAG